MLVPFTKMQGLGNDFVVFDFTNEPYNLLISDVQKIADRKLGVGCDQILIIEQSSRPEIDFKYRILNCDGTEVGQCGNGARCAALFIHQEGLSTKQSINIETITGDMVLNINDDLSLVTVDMGVPKFEPNDIPANYDKKETVYSEVINGDAVDFYALSIGNPHAVIKVESVDDAPVVSLGSEIESHSSFPERVNVGFMTIKNRDNIDLRVFERGVGETLACGSGACAAVVAGIAAGELNSQVTVSLTGGKLIIDWQGDGTSVLMTGPAQTSFHGKIELS